MPDFSQYKVGVIISVEDCGNQSANKARNKACIVNVGDEANPITVVTSASNVRVGSRYVRWKILNSMVLISFTLLTKFCAIPVSLLLWPGRRTSMKRERNRL
jgi:hypothetical protein